MKKQRVGIPGYFKYLQNNGSHSTPLYPLRFEVSKAGKEEFVISEKRIPVSKFKTRRYDINLQGVEDKYIEYRTMRDHPLLVSDRGLIVVGPMLVRSTINKVGRGDLSNRMFSELGLNYAYDSLGGFCLRRTSGSHATIGPAQSSNFIEPPGERGFAEYVYLGDHDRGDRLVLLAGLGFLATRALED